jgi:UDP-glucose 4-epimerase
MISNSCLVTGGAGFIGSHLVTKLLADGHKVIVLDHSLGENLSHLKNNKNLSVVKIDISVDGNKLARYFKDIDWVFHLAGKSSIALSIDKPSDCHKVNVSSTLYVLEACRRAKIKKFVYAASSTCYGIPDKYPTPETAPIRPQYPYALTKYIGEQYVFHWGKIYKLPVVSLRLFDIYGVPVNKFGSFGPLLSIFMAQKLKGIPLTVAGDGTQKRDFTYVTDVVTAFITAAKSKISGEVFNVGSGETHTINEMVKFIGWGVVYIPKRRDERDCNFADISKIRKMLRWVPEVSFTEGMRKVMEAEGKMGKRRKK